ncbi:MAG: hypothetical protein H6509_14545 [Bryobacterales bacterium]|nr:hypothetical protein [Bryobacterales bacterium]
MTTEHEHVTAELAWLKRRGREAAPARHPLRTPTCPSLATLARGELSAGELGHVTQCRHCQGVLHASEPPRRFAAPLAAGMAAALLVGLWLSGGSALERYEAPAARIAAPSPRAVEVDWTPPTVRAPGVRLTLPAPTPLPRIRPLERFQPPESREAPIPLAALGAPNPPRLEPAPPPDVVGLLGLRVL